MRGLIVELLERHGTGQTIAVAGPERLSALFADTIVDVLVVDGADFPGCCRWRFPYERVVVIGAEPDAAYEALALRAGAGAWLPRDRVGEDLLTTLHHTLANPRAQRRTIA